MNDETTLIEKEKSTKCIEKIKNEIYKNEIEKVKYGIPSIDHSICPQCKELSNINNKYEHLQQHLIHPHNIYNRLIQWSNIPLIKKMSNNIPTFGLYYINNNNNNNSISDEVSSVLSIYKMIPTLEISFFISLVNIFSLILIVFKLQSLN